MKEKTRIAVLDLETQNAFSEVEPGRLDLLKVSVAGLYCYWSDDFQVLEEGELKKLDKLLPQLDLLVGFNQKRFDLPVLAPYLSIDLKQIPCLDILEEIKNYVGYRVNLNSVAKATLNKSKSGHGLEAIAQFREGRIEELKSYCLDDVKITKEVFDYGILHDKIYFLAKDGSSTIAVPVDWKKYLSPASRQIQLL